LSQADATIQEKEELLDTLEGDAARVRQEMEMARSVNAGSPSGVDGAAAVSHGPAAWH
jgi:hypothetical protein